VFARTADGLAHPCDQLSDTTFFDLQIALHARVPKSPRITSAIKRLIAANEQEPTWPKRVDLPVQLELRNGTQ